MTSTILRPCLCLVTDRSLAGSGSLITRVVQAVEGGVDMVQLREKDLSGGPLLKLADSLKDAIQDKALLIINERVDIMQFTGASGVQLGEDGPPVERVRRLIGLECLIGRSVHSVTGAGLRPGAGPGVTGKIAGRPWLRIDHETLGRAYVHAALVEHLWYAAIAAAYEGTVTNAVRPGADRVVTRLAVQGGKLTGTYTVFEPEGETKGTLGDFVSTGGGKGVFRWRDNYGAGTLAVEFSGDMGTFSGAWTPEGQAGGGGTWSGRR